jgi:hypothetical protein
VRCPDRVSRLGKARLVTSRKHHRMAILGELICESPTDTSGGPGDDGGGLKRLALFLSRRHLLKPSFFGHLTFTDRRQATTDRL